MPHSGPRYPGSLVARVLINKYYALRRKYRKPTNEPGRLDTFTAWFLRWEGLLFGGLLMSGVVAGTSRIYQRERLDDIDRRIERVEFYEGSCLMGSAHLAAVQNSLAFWEDLVQTSQHRIQQRQQWQQQQQQRTKLAAAQLQKWNDRCDWLCARKLLTQQQQQQQQQQGWAEDTALQEHGQQHQQETESRHKSQIETEIESQIELQDLDLDINSQQYSTVKHTVGHTQQHSHTQQQQQQQLLQNQTQLVYSNARPQQLQQQQQQQQPDAAQQEVDQQQHHLGLQQQHHLGLQQQQQQQQGISELALGRLFRLLAGLHALIPSWSVAADHVPSSSSSSSHLLMTMSTEHEPQAEHHNSDIAERQQQGQDQQHQRHNQQQQQQQQSSWNPICYYALAQAAAAEQVLWQQQQRLVLAEVGQHLWEDLHQLGKQKVRLLRVQQEQQQALLMAHVTQLAVWQKLHTRNNNVINIGFDLPDYEGLWGTLNAAAAAAASVLYSQQEVDSQQQQDGELLQNEQQQQQRAVWGDFVFWRAGYELDEKTRKQQQQQQQQRHSQSGVQANSLQNQQPGLLQRWFNWSKRQQQQQSTSTTKETELKVTTAAAKAETAVVNRRHVSVRLLVPIWVPDDVEERDYELVDSEFVRRTAAAAAAADVELDGDGPEVECNNAW